MAFAGGVPARGVPGRARMTSVVADDEFCSELLECT